MEGCGVYIIVDGYKMMLEVNDFVFIFNGIWYEYGVEVDGLFCIWQDGLDILLVNVLEVGFYVVYFDLYQVVIYLVDDVVVLWGVLGLCLQDVGWNRFYLLFFKYQWGLIYEVL